MNRQQLSAVVDFLKSIKNDLELSILHRKVAQTYEADALVDKALLDIGAMLKAVGAEYAAEVRAARR